MQNSADLIVRHVIAHCQVDERDDRRDVLLKDWFMKLVEEDG